MHFHWTASFPVLRRLLSTLGRRWVAAGWLDKPEDVYCLSVDELAPLAREPRPLQAQVARARRAWERDKHRPWPTEIAGGREVYAEEPGPHVVGRDALSGIAGSPGLALGRVRVVRDPEEFGKLRQGDILVAPLTNPVWTPLFALAGGIVTEAGGILSHGAIVAREYGIPAVLGVAGATRALEDDQLVTVDGTNGVVVLEGTR
jgi:pyruvate,water dikinase